MSTFDNESEGSGPNAAPLPFTGAAENAMAIVVAVVEDMPRSRIITRTGDYLHVEFRSRVFRFVDDVEILIDRAARLVHFRSASRAGYSDLGVNRERMASFARIAGPRLIEQAPATP